jgi:hypothetical protein
MQVTMENGLARTVSVEISECADLLPLLVELGLVESNDAAPVESVFRQLSAAIRAASEKGGRVVVTTLLPAVN